ncbi:MULTISPECIES: GNAT family N-acetyltransferase [unclassified Bacillus (in: firmicutes)]|uniref:GNAT family N-acetyltransferase n=1 Tax=unclassified Bacillus (in: firmicutes) TaxID=185979 RepID=UPI0015CF165C|nr:MULTISPECIES: GNAT family protein [unclassified Bacillus (in: firmicutes)]
MKEVIVRPYTFEDAEAKLELHQENKDHFEKWSPTLRKDDFYTVEGQLNTIKEFMEKSAEDARYDFAIYVKDDDATTLIGEVQFIFVTRGPKQSCMVGYQIGEKFNGQGYMTKALNAALKIAFEELKFHRVTSEVNPENLASLRVLEKVGFVKEGYYRKNLKIRDQWYDHVCLAILEEEFAEKIAHS